MVDFSLVLVVCPQIGVSVGGRAEVEGQQRVIVFGGLVFLPDSPPPLHPLPRRHTAGRIQWSGESGPVRPVRPLRPVWLVKLVRQV